MDIALAQIAALGAAAASLVGIDADDPRSYWFGLAATLVGALVLSLTRSRKRQVSQEAVIGVVYAVSAAAAILLVDRVPHGAEHLRSMLIGSILTVPGSDVAKVAALYAAIGRVPLALPAAVLPDLDRSGGRISRWVAGTVVGLSLLCVLRARRDQLCPGRRRVAGVLLSDRARPGRHRAGRGDREPAHGRLGVRDMVSVVGMVASALLDLPTGATVACVFGARPAALVGVRPRLGKAAPGRVAAGPCMREAKASR